MRGIVSDKKRRLIFDYHRKNADLLVLLETHSSPNNESIWTNEWGGKIIFSHGSTQARGIAVCTSKEIFNRISNIHICTSGRLILFDIEEKGVLITIGALYAPNEDNPKFFTDVGVLLKERQEKKIIIGDFNLALDPSLDRKNTYCNNNRARDEVLSIMQEFMLKDVCRERNLDKLEFSWMKKQHRGVERKTSRIDFALISGGLDQMVKEIMYLSSLMTDHRAVYVVIEVSDKERGKGYWKLNTALLRDKEFGEYMNQEIMSSLASQDQKEPISVWECLKARIKKATISYSRGKVSRDQEIIANLSEKVNEYEARLPLDQEEDDLYEKTKLDLEEKMNERVEGIMFRSKARWYELGEKNTKYFYSLEKVKYNAKTCYKLISEEGNDIVGDKNILEIQKDFYEKLYSVDQDVQFCLQNEWNIRVPLDIRVAQDISLTMEDLQVAAMSMNNNKTPGGDGIPVDFYKVFWKCLRDPFLKVVQKVYEDKKLHKTAREGILNLIPKPNKDSRYIKNLRPITLLNTDYKIIEKAIANKILPALEHIIHGDQRGFMKNRRISVNIRKMLDIIHHAKKEELEAVILSLDFVKCFDKCSFTILHGSLEFFGFGEVVKEWTKILYDDFSVKIQNNGKFSRNIDICKGVHQGGCCSSLYFLVIAEILALSLRDNKDINPIYVRWVKNLLNQFADDLDIFSLCNQKSLRAIFHELEQFRRQSGFTLSYEKTTLYRIGSLRHSCAEMYNVSEVTWSNQDINVLGVTIAHQDLVDKNYESIVTRIRSDLKGWGNRGLSLMGRVQVVNTLVASLFVYKMMVLPMIPKTIISRVDNLIREFLWDGKKAKIAYKILQNSKRDGGLNLVNLKNKEIALKATWPQILYTEKDYSELVYGELRCASLGEDIWRCSLTPEDVDGLKIRNQFWVDILKSWCNFNYFYDIRMENQLLWFNSRIRVQNKPVWWKDVYQKGLKNVCQLFCGNKFKTDEQVWEEYGLSKLRFNSLKASLPKEWKDFFICNLEITYTPMVPHNYDRVINGQYKNFSQLVYKYINGDFTMLQSKYLGWRKELGSANCEDLGQDMAQFGQLHMDLYKVTNVAKLRSFQYRLLQRGLVTNVHLE